MKQNRIPWVDAAKGLLMLFVVIGHSRPVPGFPIPYAQIYWFHMPAFFILAGVTFKPCADWQSFFFVLRRKALTYFIPYLVYLSLNKLAASLFHQPVALMHKNGELFWLLFGGRFISGVYWFVTCMFFTQMLLHLVFLLIKKDIIRIGVVGTAFLLAHIESLLLIKAPGAMHFFVPWSMDTALFTLAFMAFGYYAKDAMQKILPTLISVGFSAGFIYLSKTAQIPFGINLKDVHYVHIFLDILVPVAFSISIFGLARLLVRFNLHKILAQIGALSLIIMYTHMCLNDFFQHYFRYGPLIYLLIGIVIPIIAGKLFERFYLTDMLFLGHYRPKKSTYIFK